MNNITHCKTNKELIDDISKVVEPYCKFNMIDIYGDRGGIPFPNIENLDTLYFKFEKILSIKQQDELVKKIKELDIGSVQIIKISGFGKYIYIELHKYNLRIIKEYEKYQNFKNLNIDKINNTYQYLEEKVPEEFVGWYMYKKINE